MNKYSSFLWQFGNSFLPANYGEYDNVDKQDTKKFIRIFAAVVYVIMAALFLLITFRSSSGITDGSIVSNEDGYKYRISGGKLKIDEPVYIDDPDNGIFVNITDKVEFFDGDIMLAFYEKGYKDVLLISQTNRVKMIADDEKYNYVVNYFDDMENTSEAGRKNAAPKIGRMTVLLIVIAGLVFCLLYPFVIKLTALILAIIEKLICKIILRFTPDKHQLKIFCTYALVPAQILGLIGTIAAVFLTGVSGADNIIESAKSSKIYIITDIITTLLPFVLVTAAEVSENKN